MPFFLAKTEPHTYSIDQFSEDKRTIWDGIKNPQALRAVRAMKSGDRVFVYHSGGQSAIVGLGEVLGEPRPDLSDDKLAVVELGYVTHIQPPTTLAEIKATHLFDEWALVRQSRLSTMTVPDEFVEWMRQRYPEMAI